MSDIRVALVAEGETDTIIIEAVLKAILRRPFVLTTLQPEATRPNLGKGWGGVLRWCVDFAERAHPNLEDDPTLRGFDLFIVHVDADVADASYVDVGGEIAEVARRRGWSQLPDARPCPPSFGSADVVRACVLQWTGIEKPGPRTVLCVPSKAAESWLAAAVFADDHPILSGLECSMNLDKQLASLTKRERIKKSVREYRTHAPRITSAWTTVRARCSQADRFSVELAALSL